MKTVPVPYLPADTARSVSSTSEYQGSRAHSRAAAAAHRPASRASKQGGRLSSGPGSSSGSNSGEMDLISRVLFNVDIDTVMNTYTNIVYFSQLSLFIPRPDS